MDIVSAGMHHAGLLRAKRHAAALLNGQGINVCPQRDQFVSGPDLRHHTGRQVVRQRRDARG